MAWKQFNPCSPCCGMPLSMISTCDSSVSYTTLCYFEDEEGNPGNSCSDGTESDDADGSCVYAPIDKDKDKWNEDVHKFTKVRKSNEKNWPVAGGIISGTGRCWAGVKEAITAISEPWVEDSYGEFEFAVGGIPVEGGEDPTGEEDPEEDPPRILLQDLKDMFVKLYDKHDFPGQDIEQDLARFGFLLIIDNTGSISFPSQWEPSAREDFEDWIEEEYPKCVIKVIVISNYIVQGEDWLRHFKEYYQDTIKRGI